MAPVLLKEAIKPNLASCYEVFPVLAERRRQLAGSMSGEAAAIAQQNLRAIRQSARLRGEITLPGDKSISHRALMFGAIAVGGTLGAIFGPWLAPYGESAVVEKVVPRRSRISRVKPSRGGPASELPE